MTKCSDSCNCRKTYISVNYFHSNKQLEVLQTVENGFGHDNTGSSYDWQLIDSMIRWHYASYRAIHSVMSKQQETTQQDYYGRRCGTPLHSYCTGTYIELTVLLLWGNFAVTVEYPHSYSVGVPAWVLQGSIGATSKKQHCYFSVGTCAVTVYKCTTSPAIVILLCINCVWDGVFMQQLLHYDASTMD